MKLIKIIKRLIPRKVNREISDSEESAERCPECLSFVFGAYCHKCGQRLKWD